jgi:hypothetical protein
MSKKLVILFLAGILVLILAGVVLAAPQVFDLSWWTVDGGGGTFSSGGDFTLGGTIGQPDAGVMQGGDYTLGGGFWGGGEVATPLSFVHLPVIRR